MIVIRLSSKSTIIAIFKMRNESGTEETVRRAGDLPVSRAEPSRTAGVSRPAQDLLKRGCAELHVLAGIHTAHRGLHGTENVQVP